MSEIKVIRKPSKEQLSETLIWSLVHFRFWNLDCGLKILQANSSSGQSILK
jgi:hypothetical protein